MRKTIFPFGIIILAALIVSCSDDCTLTPVDSGGDPPANLITMMPVDLDFGETIILKPEDLAVTFAAVPYDSRCPSDAVCVWEGQAVITLRLVDAQADRHDVYLTIRGGYPPADYAYAEPFDTLGYRFLFLNLTPYPVSDQPISDSAYTATLAVFAYSPVDSSDGEVQISDLDPVTIQVDRFGLDSIRIADGLLLLDVNYSGGCLEHEFELHMSPAAFSESYPVQANLYLRHVDPNDPCDAIVGRRLAFDLRALAQLYEVMYGRIDPIKLNVYRYFADVPGDKLTVVYYPERGRVTERCQ